MSFSFVRLAFALLLVTSCYSDLHDADRSGSDDSSDQVVLEGSALASELSQSPARVAPVPFRRLGVQWSGGSADGFEVSTSSDGSTWSRWRAVTVRHTEVEAQASYIGEIEAPDDTLATHYRLRATRTQRPSVVSLSFFRQSIAAELEIGEVAAPAAFSIGTTRRALSIGSVEVNARSAWGATAPRCDSGSHTPKKLTIHHTATPNSDSSSPEAQLRGIQKFHKDVRGWCDIAYHFLISPDGRIWEGRPVGTVGSHAKGNNTNNVGISFIGTFEDRQPSQEQVDSAVRLVAALGSQFSIDVTTLKGHRQIVGTTCPGDTLFGMLPTIIERAGGEGGTPPPPPPPPPPAADKVVVKGFVFEAGNADAVIAGASVVIDGRTLTTNDRGLYEVEVAPGSYEITASAQGFVSTSISRTVTASVDGAAVFASIGLSRQAEVGKGAIQGLVFVPPDQKDVVAGASVFLDNGRSTTTDAEGFYRFDDLPPGPFEITASAPGKGSGKVTQTAVNGQVAFAHIPLTPGQTPPPPPPPTPITCQGQCGSLDPVPGSTPDCFCDASCDLFDDCCTDRTAVCGATQAGSCAGNCFSLFAVSSGAGECFCDSACGQFGDCCGDFADQCGDAPPATCAGKCGSATAVFGPSGICYCDSLCKTNGDCCADHPTVCGGSTTGSSACTGQCGSTNAFTEPGGRDCYCDDLCSRNGDCCAGFETVCP